MAHNLLWNIIPTPKEANFQKSDNLPDPLYLDDGLFESVEELCCTPDNRQLLVNTACANKVCNRLYTDVRWLRQDTPLFNRVRRNSYLPNEDGNSRTYRNRQALLQHPLATLPTLPSLSSLLPWYNSNAGWTEVFIDALGE